MRVAVVEDEKPLAHAIREGLEDEGHTIDVFYDGESAFSGISADGNYDAVVLDLVLPKRDGFSVAKDLREKNNPVPIIVLTARDTVEDKVRALDSGADDFITKPFAFEELLARLRAVSRRSHELTPEELSVGDLSVRPATHEVLRAGKSVFLTLKEFELLLFLMRHPGQVKTRDEIFHHLWKGEAEPTGNVVDVHVRNLRKKLNDDAQHIVRTMRGVGYAVAG